MKVNQARVPLYPPVHPAHGWPDGALFLPLDPPRSMEEVARELAAEATALAGDAGHQQDHPDLIRRRVGHLYRLVEQLREFAPSRRREDA